MRHLNKIITFLLFISCGISIAQTEVGNRIDINGIPFDGYLDQLSYAPNERLEFTHQSDSYEIGRYTDITGHTHSGFIKFENDKIWFKETEDSFRDKIKPEDIDHLVIGVDSFIKINNFYFRDKLRTKKELVQYLTEVDGKIFVKRYHFTSAMAQGYTNASPIIESYFVKEKEATEWKEIPKDRSYNNLGLTFFPSEGNSIIDLFALGKIKYKEKNIMHLIKYLDYANKLKNDTPIYFDKYWQEVRTKDKAYYHANITNKIGSIWTLEYFQDTTKLYSGQYSSFYPNTKNGNFISFYPNGNKRKLTIYSDDKAKTTTSYNSDGSVINSYRYSYTEKETFNGTKEELNFRYNQSSSSKNDIYTNVYSNNKLVKSYTLQKTDTVFQLTSKDIRLRLNSIQTRLNTLKSTIDYKKAISENAQGIVLIKLRVNPKGYVTDKEVLNSIHPDFDNVVNTFIFQTFISGEYKLQLKPYKRNRKKYYYDITIPIEFSTVRFYRRPVNYNNGWHMQHMMMNQMNTFQPKLSTPF